VQDAGTVYFNESAEEALEFVKQVLEDYEGVLKAVSDEEKGKLQRFMGLEMEQLKAELKELNHLHDDD
jgi:hypothetical protein